MPICNVLSLGIPVVVGTVGFYLVRTAKGASNMGEALGPYFAWVLCLVIAAVAGEVAALSALFREERLVWLSWLGVVVNGLLLLPAVLLALGADWR